MRNSGYRVIALTAAIGAAAAVLALTTHRDSATDVAPATTAGAATSGATPSWPAGSIVITGSNGDGVTVLDPTGAARQDIHWTDPVTVLVPAAGTAHAGSIQLADQTTGQVSTLAPPAARQPSRRSGAARSGVPPPVTAPHGKATPSGWTPPAGRP